MPELPDLEIFKSNLSKRLGSKRLTGLNVFNFVKVLVPENFLTDELRGRELLSVNRVGKELYFDFGDSRVVTAHLMLNGEMTIAQKTEVPQIKFKIFSFDFEHESLVFSDEGALCTIKYKPSPNSVPDALDASFTLEYLMRVARRKSRMNVKMLLIDQKIVRGIGNAYVDEILWAARISPHSLIGKIPDDALGCLYNSIGAVLKNAIESIRKISPDIISGEERSFLKVHNKNLNKTETGHKIIVERIASKITYYTDEQELYL
jgi:formamidopyrimidine-DNA glycosylase